MAEREITEEEYEEYERRLAKKHGVKLPKKGDVIFD